MRYSRHGLLVARALVPATAVGVIGTVAFVSMVPSPTESYAATSAAVSPEPEDLGAMLMRMGISPQTLAAAGVRGPAVTTLVDDTRSALTANDRFTAIIAADEICRGCAGDVNTLRRLVQSGKGDEHTRDLLGDARIALATARQNQQALMDAVYQAAVAQLTTEQIATLEQLKAREDLAVPLPMRLTELGSDQWPGIRDAFNHTEQFDINDEDYSHAAGQLVGSVRAESVVSVANTNLDLYLAETQAAFELALHDN